MISFCLPIRTGEQTKGFFIVKDFFRNSIFAEIKQRHDYDDTSILCQNNVSHDENKSSGSYYSEIRKRGFGYYPATNRIFSR